MRSTMVKAVRSIAAHTLPTARVRPTSISAVLLPMRLGHNAPGALAPTAAVVVPRVEVIARAHGEVGVRAASSCTSSQPPPPHSYGNMAVNHPDEGTLDECKLFVSNLSYDTTAAEVSDIFGKCGTITNLFCPAPHKASTLARRRASAQNRGFARITFADAQAARMAIRTLDGTAVGGREVAVTIAKSRAWQRRQAALLKSRSKARAHKARSAVLDEDGLNQADGIARERSLIGADASSSSESGLAQRNRRKRRSKRPMCGDILRCGNDWQQAIEMLGIHSLDHDAAREAAKLVQEGGKGNHERALKLGSYGRHCVDARRGGAALTVCANARQWEPALALLERLRAQRDLGGADGPWCPDTYCYLQAIEACTAAGKWQRALEVLSQWRVERRPHMSEMPQKVRQKEQYHASQCYAVVIGACGKASQKNLAMKLLRQLRPPDKRAYNAALRACTFAGDVEHALELIDEMRSNVHVGSPSIASYNSVLIACNLTGNWRRAVDVLHSMEADVRIDARNYLTAIRACGSGGSVEGEALQAAVQITKTMWQRLEFGSLPFVSQQELIEIVKLEAGLSDEVLSDQLSSELEQLLTHHAGMHYGPSD